MTRPLLLDLFCGAGGAAMGYHRAGFDVVGVDIAPQPHYPFEFHQGDAMTWPLDGYDAIHASPPCQDHSALKVKHAGHGNGWMLAATIGRLRDSGAPWVVENVPGSGPSMPGQWTVLCGSSFGLDVRRHRLFTGSLLILAPPCSHDWQTPRFRSLDKRRTALASVVGVHGHINYSGEQSIREQAMGVDWMTPTELTQAIPPAYTEFIGAQLLQHVRAAA
jgi:DNA (cytosine-5)-methyltransferase 1